MSLPPLYTSLASESKQFRLLLVHPGTSDQVQCSFRIAELSLDVTPPQYETVSYVWGNGALRETAIVDGHRVDAPASSIAVLRRVRLHDRTRLVWIDAICINQEDLDERAQQVAMMKDIYSKGTQNLIYWAEDDALEPWAERAVRSVRDIVEDGSRGDFLSVMLGENGVYRGLNAEHNVVNCAYDVRALIRLLETPWLQRLWTFQEACLPRLNVCLVGSFEVDLLIILRAGMWLMHNFEYIQIGVKEALMAANVDQLWLDVDPEYGYGGRARHPLAIARKARDRQCSNPCDKIYGCLGMIANIGITVDYSKSATDVYQEFAMAAIASKKDLIMLDDVGVRVVDYGQNRDDLPSWVPDFSLPFNSVAGPYRWGLESNAAAGLDAKVSFETSATGRVTLKAVGFEIGRVQSVAARSGMAADGTSYSSNSLLEYRTIAAQTLVTDTPVEDVEAVLAETLIAGRDWQSRASTREGALIGFRALAAFAEARHDAQPDQALAARYTEAAAVANHNRKLFSTSGGHIGLAPSGIRTDDVVAILYGAKWPAVLRPEADSFVFCGYAWMYGVMQGEAMQHHLETSNAEIEFKIS